MYMYENIENVIQQIKNSQKIVLAGHVSPDGDAVSACFALALAIAQISPFKPTILLEKYPSIYSNLEGEKFLYKGDYSELNPDLFISLDCGDIERLGVAKDIFLKAKNTINIDHHESNNCFAHLNVVNAKASSTSEVIFEIISKMQDASIDLNIANCIYTGLVFDTSGFKHTSTSKRTHEIAGALVEKGIDSSEIHTKLLYTHSLENAKLLAISIQNAYIENNILVSYLTKEEILEKANARYSDMEGIVGYLLDFKGIDVTIFLYEKIDGNTKVSFRSKSLDVNKIASLFGGGGHILASGALLHMPLIQAKEEVLQIVRQEMKNFN